MAQFNIFVLALVAIFAGCALAHPELSDRELAEYQDLVSQNTEALGRCLESPELQTINARIEADRTAALKHIRQARGIDVGASRLIPRNKADLLKWLGINHRHQDQNTHDPQSIWHFKWSDKPSRQPAGCILTPESIYGPYWLEGQIERQNIRDGKPGIPLRLAMQVIDLNTCVPIHGARVDVWHAGAVGEYSGKAQGFLRGWQPSSPWGTIDYDTIFPGHYPGRSNHIHVAMRPYNSQKVAHTGMLYFDDALIHRVENTTEYLKNTATLTENKNDGFAPAAASSTYDPFVRWNWIGTKAEDGILAWIAMGVNASNPNIPQPPNSRRKRSMFDDHLDH
ncbi:aromatic compound dioxygenase [Polyplosphaeria fusca]|uniref:Aromatic compound dioxygenase n=1 Tax=Polyplosphaeria fusca TaxID=682080 RepID=A0A9P4V0S3_9PLEO|nr:aromatic compound dioxygenase [Polyplosphaeria fusca]